MKFVKDLDEGTFCKVMSDGSLREAFDVKSGVIQGGILSPLFLSLLLVM